MNDLEIDFPVRATCHFSPAGAARGGGSFPSAPKKVLKDLQRT